MSKKEIVVNAERDQTRIAIVEDGRLAELFIESPENERTIGNICLGRVRRVMPSIRAAFVDIGQEQDAFLHFSDLTESLPFQLEFLKHDEPSVAKTMQNVDDPPGGRKGSHHRQQEKLRKKLRDGGRILVKISKEPISQKGSRVSTDLSIAGRFLVLVPFTDFVAVSNKIDSDKEQKRLEALAESLLPEGFGVIVRTAAQGRDAKSLDTDLSLLKDKWDALEDKLQGKPSPPKTVHEDVNMVSSIMRDLFSEDYDRVLIDYARLHQNIQSYVQAVAPQKADAIQLHQGDRPVFEAAGIDGDVTEAFQSRVSLPSGGYLFIEHTEAMHVVDVNSGGAGRGMSQEESSLKVNLEAARTIARQTRLRDMGGIIVIDFIDLRSGKDREKVYNELKKVFSRDRAVSKILPMSDFGLVQITRQRLRPSLTKTFSGPDGEPLVDEERKKDEAYRKKQPTEEAPPAPQNGAPRETAREEASALAEQGASGEEGASGEDSEERGETAAAETTTAASAEQQHAAPDEDGVEPVAAPAPPALEPDAFVERLEDEIADYKQNGSAQPVTLRVHPFAAAYLNRSVPSYPTQWFMEHLVRVRLEADEDLAPTDFRLIDAQSGDELSSGENAEASEAAPAETTA
jgi:ribonuclease G